MATPRQRACHGAGRGPAPATADGPHGPAKPGSGFVVGQALKMTEDDRGTVLLGQPADRFVRARSPRRRKVPRRVDRRVGHVLAGVEPRHSHGRHAGPGLPRGGRPRRARPRAAPGGGLSLPHQHQKRRLEGVLDVVRIRRAPCGRRPAPSAHAAPRSPPAQSVSPLGKPSRVRLVQSRGRSRPEQPSEVAPSAAASPARPDCPIAVGPQFVAVIALLFYYCTPGHPQYNFFVGTVIRARSSLRIARKPERAEFLVGHAIACLFDRQRGPQ